jgi:6-phosphogluconolactonase (cycloisomerase 2 family)
MRRVAARIASLTLVLAVAGLSTPAAAEPLTINQDGWLNYAVIVNASRKVSDLVINQRGDTNLISSVQLSGGDDAQIFTHQSGRRNTGAIHQSGWITISRVIQEGPQGPVVYQPLPTRLSGQQTDEGYLSYFMTGGFSLVTLTDQNHTWFSRFGRAR